MSDTMKLCGACLQPVARKTLGRELALGETMGAYQLVEDDHCEACSPAQPRPATATATAPPEPDLQDTVAALLTGELSAADVPKPKPTAAPGGPDLQDAVAQAIETEGWR